MAGSGANSASTSANPSFIGWSQTYSKGDAAHSLSTEKEKAATAAGKSSAGVGSSVRNVTNSAHSLASKLMGMGSTGTNRLPTNAQKMPIKQGATGAGAGAGASATPQRGQYGSLSNMGASQELEAIANSTDKPKPKSTNDNSAKLGLLQTRNRSRTRYHIQELSGLVTKFKPTTTTTTARSSASSSDNLLSGTSGNVQVSVSGSGTSSSCPPAGIFEEFDEDAEIVAATTTFGSGQGEGQGNGLINILDPCPYENDRDVDSDDDDEHKKKDMHRKDKDMTEKEKTAGLGLHRMGGIASTIDDSNVDFFHLVAEEMDKINKFYAGKIATLRVKIGELSLEDDMTRHQDSGDTGINFKTLRDLYLQVLFLRSYSELCHEGFYKILKKYDKIMVDANAKDKDGHVKAMPLWMRLVDKQPFVVVTEVEMLMESIQRLISRDKLLELEQYALDHANHKLDVILPSVRVKGLLFSFCVLIVMLLNPNDLVAGDKCASRCAVLLAFTISMWVTEAIPYFATAMLILPLTVLLDCFKDPTNPGHPMSRTDAADLVTNSVLNHTSMLLLGGFTMSAAISRCQLELQVAAYLQEKLGENPRGFILALMFVCLGLSLCLANHTAPILASSIVMPIVKDLPSDSRFSKALLLGMAFACNFGGMLTPISSLQNVLAVTHLASIGIDISYGRWILVGVPFATICTLICWFLLMKAFEPNDVTTIPVVVYQIQEHGQRQSRALLLLSLTCMILFATSSETDYIFGDIGVIALIFLSTVFGTGMLSEVDFSSLSWSTLMLVGGGNVLGKAIASSGLLVKLAAIVIKVLPAAYPWFSLVQILFLVLVTATFISHTVAAIILLPIIGDMGVTLGLPETVVMGSAMAISAAMALPFSSFPNVNTLRIKDDSKASYLSSFDFARVGLPMSFITVLLIATLGLGLIDLVDPGSPSKHHAYLQPIG